METSRSADGLVPPASSSSSGSSSGGISLDRTQLLRSSFRRSVGHITQVSEWNLPAASDEIKHIDLMGSFLGASINDSSTGRSPNMAPSSAPAAFHLDNSSSSVEPGSLRLYNELHANSPPLSLLLSQPNDSGDDVTQVKAQLEQLKVQYASLQSAMQVLQAKHERLQHKYKSLKYQVEGKRHGSIASQASPRSTSLDDLSALSGNSSPMGSVKSKFNHEKGIVFHITEPTSLHRPPVPAITIPSASPAAPNSSASSSNLLQLNYSDRSKLHSASDDLEEIGSTVSTDSEDGDYSSAVNHVNPPPLVVASSSAEPQLQHALLEPESLSPQKEICRHFLKGKCRYKKDCKFSHSIDRCPYCGEKPPSGKIAASAHLARCWKSYEQKMRQPSD